MSEERGTEGLSDSDIDALAVVVAHRVMSRFNAIMGEPLICSPVVFLAAKEVLLTVFGPEPDPLKALDEIEALEAALHGPGPKGVTT